ncbi:hypothetical protein TYRP_016705 [Tyrophagus putrescentiae]|nr:hypothetical protein TYRP_016705 [Tyrophagus putrescentiae]
MSLISIIRTVDGVSRLRVNGRSSRSRPTEGHHITVGGTRRTRTPTNRSQAIVEHVLVGEEEVAVRRGGPRDGAGDVAQVMTAPADHCHHRGPRGDGVNGGGVGDVLDGHLVLDGPGGEETLLECKL